MDEVQVQSIDTCLELRNFVQSAFLLSPVVFRSPVLDQFFHVAQVDPVLPAGLVYLVGPAGVGTSLLEVVQYRLLDLNPKWPNLLRTDQRSNAQQQQ